jgi:hypothetical protein
LWQNAGTRRSKNSHISDLNFTKSTAASARKISSRLKTRWKVWNSTRKVGADA